MNAQHNFAKTYSINQAYGGVTYADSHSLILQMFDGALKRIAQAKGAIQHKVVDQKATHISHAIAIIGSLEGCLNNEKGGDLSKNLSDLYEYMNLRLAEANINNDIEKLEEVIRLINEIKSAWVQIPRLLEEQK